MIVPPYPIAAASAKDVRDGVYSCPVVGGNLNSRQKHQYLGLTHSRGLSSFAPSLTLKAECIKLSGT